LNNGGERQNVEPSTQRYTSGTHGDTSEPDEHGEYEEKLAEAIAERNTTTDISSWKYAKELTSQDEVDAIIAAFDGKPISPEKAAELPIMKKYQSRQDALEKLVPYENQDTMIRAENECYDLMLDQCKGKGYEPKKERKLALIVGLPSSGKSSIMDKRYTNAEGGYVLCDSDHIKSCGSFSRWYDDGIGASAVASASADVQMKLIDRFADEGYNLAVPVVGSAFGSIKNLIDLASEKGYEINIVQKNEDPGVCSARLVKRFVESGRLVGLPYFMVCARRCPKIYDAMKREFDESKTIGGKRINGYEII